MLQLLSDLDRKILFAINGTHSTFFDALMLSASSLFSLIPIGFIVVYIAMRIKKGEHYHHFPNILTFLISVLIISCICLGVLPRVFSILFEIQKPCLNPNTSDFIRLLGETCKQEDNFFPFRPCLFFCISSFLIFALKEEFRLVKILFIAWSLLVSYSRIYLGAHFPFNVFIASFIGLLLGFAGSKIYYYLSEKVFVF